MSSEESRRRTSRRSGGDVSYAEDKREEEDDEIMEDSSENQNVAEDDDDDDDDEMEIEEAPRRSRRATTKVTSATDTTKTTTNRRTSSRSTKFSSSMAEPSKSIADLWQQRTTTSPHKSPARRHRQRRLSLRHDDDDDEDESESEASERESDQDDDDDDDDDDEQSPVKIQRILASRTETRQRWNEICRNLHTTELDTGSRWFQAQDGDEEDSDVFEERFLVKWADLGYLHCSWETQADLIEQIEGAKTYLTTFFRKSHHGVLLSADERCDGDYFDPAYTQVERILEIMLPENGETYEMSVELEDAAQSFGMIMDRQHPDFEEGTGRQFLIKWTNLPYSQATYEFERDLILREVEYKGAVKDFLKRSTKVPKRKREAFLKSGVVEQKRLYKVFGEDSSLDESRKEKAVEKYKRELQEKEYKNGGQLRDYQGEGVAWMVSNFVNGRSCILADEMGLGKTLQTAAFVNILLTQMNRGGPVLVVVPLSTITHWYREFTSWTDLNTVVYHGSSEDRDEIRRFEMVHEEYRPQGGVAFNQLYLRKCLPKRGSSKAESPWMFDVLITTPEMIVADDFVELTVINWECLVVDEAHRLKNHNSKLAVTLRDKRFKIEHILLLTGTPIQNSIEEFWALLNLLEPDKYDDAEKFMELYGDMKSKERVDQLHDEIRPYILRRLKEDVEKSVPAKSETLIEVELTIQQKKWYRALYEKNVKFLHKNKKKALDGPSLNNLAMELRKCCNHLFLLNGAEEEMRREHAENGKSLSEGDFLTQASGKLVLLDKLLPRLKEEGHRLLIFSQFKIMLDILEDYLNERFMKFERIDGSITGNRRQQAIDRFQAPSTPDKEPPFIMMLSTRAGGVGINLTAADTCIIFDSDFNPQNDLQAQARCHRIGQTKTVKVYRLLTRKTYEMQMFHMSSLKMGLDQAVLKGFETGSSEGALSKDEVEKLLRHGAYDIFNEDKDGRAEAESNDFVQQDIDSILERRSRTVVHENTGSQSDAAGGTFSKARFSAGPRSPETKEKEKAADVDIEDPEFWKKVLGDVTADDDDDLASKPRQRSKANYSEREYQRQLEAQLRLDGTAGSSDESGSEDEEEDDENTDSERGRWGGGGESEWKKDDVESLMKSLSTHGYMLKTWEEFRASFQTGKAYADEEIKRMCWALVLFTLLEATDDDVDSARKRVEKEALKRAGDQAEKEEGGILAGLARGSPEIDEEKERSHSFSLQWRAIASWSSTVIEDAVSFAKSREPRDDSAEKDNRKDAEKDEGSPKAEFEKVVWPCLEARGWNRNGDNPDKMKYTYKEKEFGSMDLVLKHAQETHSELAVMVNKLIQSIESSHQESLESDRMERSKHLSMTPESVDYETISRFVDLYAPKQLVVDRRKHSTSKLRLSKRLLQTCTLLKTASELVENSKVEGSKANVDVLEKTLSVNKKASLPHPLWTSHHDAVLILSIAQHGWIEQESSCRAITNDSSIQWGAPFDSVEGVSGTSETISSGLVDAAHRAASFLSINHSWLVDAKGFNHEHVVRTFGLFRETHEGQLTNNWRVDEAKLVPSSGEPEMSDLPTKRDLVKRAKLVLSKRSQGPAEETKGDTKPQKVTHGYTLLDQSDRSNILLAELMRGILKTPSSSKSLKLFLSAAMNEVEQLHTSASESESSQCELRKVWDQLLTVQQNLSKATTQSKNIVRVMLGMEPFKPKKSNADDPLFPKASATIRRTGALAVTKSWKPTTKQRGAPKLPTGEASIETAIETFNDTSFDNLASIERNFVRLTEIETLLLSLLGKYGVPLGKLMPENDAPLSWHQIGQLITESAGEEEAKAAKALSDARAKDVSEVMLAALQKDYEMKTHVVSQASEYMKDLSTLSKKALMLVAKIRQQWGATSVSTYSEHSYHGLGARVMLWFDSEIGVWAAREDLTDHRGKALGFTAVDFINDVSPSDREKISIYSLIDRKGCRQVVGQMAMMTKIQSLMKRKEGEVLSSIETAVNRIGRSGKVWSHMPTWWKTERDDKFLIRTICEVGLTEELLKSFAHSHGLTGDTLQLTLNTLQYRANQLVRELYLLDKSKSLSQSSNTVKPSLPAATQQTGLQWFFQQKDENASNVIDLSTPTKAGSTASSALRLDDYTPAAKRKSLDNDSDTADKKRRST